MDFRVNRTRISYYNGTLPTVQLYDDTVLYSTTRYRIRIILHVLVQVPYFLRITVGLAYSRLLACWPVGAA
jgi:hypothetical protein